MDDDDYLDIDLNFPILDEKVAELIEEKFNSKYFDLVNINKYPLISFSPPVMFCLHSPSKK